MKTSQLGILPFALALSACGSYPYNQNGYGDGYDPPQEPDPQQQQQPYEQAAQEDYEDTDPAALQDFYPLLAPYGTWVTDPNYGTVWVPDPGAVGADFAPYQTGGYWSYADDGDYLWNSNYSWGYVPFHYGRWVYITGRSWSWVPGRRYAPAWVLWRTSDVGYVGWAPMPPSWYWVDGSAYPLWAQPGPAWAFCPSGYFFYPNVHTHVIRDRQTIERIAAHSKVYTPPRKYTPAQPKPGQGGGSWELKSAEKYQRGAPSLGQMGIPASAVPKERGKADANALALATRAGSGQWKDAVRAEAARRNQPNPFEHQPNAPAPRAPGGWEVGSQPVHDARPNPQPGAHERVAPIPRPSFAPPPQPVRPQPPPAHRAPMPPPPPVDVPRPSPAGPPPRPPQGHAPAPMPRPPVVHGGGGRVSPSPAPAPKGGSSGGGSRGGGGHHGGGGGRRR